MDPDTFEKTIANRQRRRNLALYEGVILDWLRQNPGMTAAQVLDWLKEHYQVAILERTARRFVERLRKQYDLPKSVTKVRQYMAVEDPPMGMQTQVDLGVSMLKTPVPAVTENFTVWPPYCPILVSNGANGTPAR